MLLPSLLKSGDQVYQKVIKQLYQKMLLLNLLITSRKNMLFCGSHEAAENTAIICSLLGSCKERGVNPREWLNDVIGRLPYYLAPKSDGNLKELLPDVWRK